MLILKYLIFKMKSLLIWGPLVSTWWRGCSCQMKTNKKKSKCRLFSLHHSVFYFTPDFFYYTWSLINFEILYVKNMFDLLTYTLLRFKFLKRNYFRLKAVSMMKTVFKKLQLHYNLIITSWKQFSSSCQEKLRAHLKKPKPLKFFLGFPLFSYTACMSHTS